MFAVIAASSDVFLRLGQPTRKETALSGFPLRRSRYGNPRTLARRGVQRRKVVVQVAARGCGPAGGSEVNYLEGVTRTSAYALRKGFSGNITITES
jgi:hypothetical protein